MKLDLPTSSLAAWVRMAGCLLLWPAALGAQQLDHLQPEPVPPQVDAPSPTVAAPNQVAKLSLPPAGEDEVLVEDFKGVAFFPTAEAAAAASVGPGLHFDGLAWLDTTTFRGVILSYLEEPITRTLLMQVTTATKLYLAQQGYPFSIVYLPEQDISDGVVRVVVVRSRLQSEIRIEGAGYFAEEQYRAALRLHPDVPLAEQTLQADVEWINRNPFRAAGIEARAGSEPGTTQLVLRVRETRPVRFFVSADNSGTASTKEERFTAGFNWGNAWGLGHQLSAQWNSSWDFRTLRSGSGSYVIDLPWRHSLSFSGAYSRTNGLVAPPFALKGTSWQVAANYDIPLAARGNFTHGWQFGVDFKSSDNNFTFASVPITDNLTHVVQARASYSGQFASRWGRTSFRATVTGAPGGLTDRNESGYFSLNRAGARADYVYFRGDASHTIALESIKRGLSWSVRGQVQLSDHNLLGSEQFAGGGRYSVRGYEEGEVYKDNGALLSHELRLPPFARAGHVVQFYGFQDYANLWSTTRLPDERTVDLHSAGVGVDYSFGRRVSFRAAYGWQFTDTGESDTGRNSRLHLSGQLSF